MEAAAGGRVLLEVPGVSIPRGVGPIPPPAGLQAGRLRLRQGPDDLVLEWEPLEGPGDPPDGTDELLDPGYEPDWAVLSPPPPPPPGWGRGFRLALGELRGLRRGPPGLGPPFLLLLPRRGPCPPPLHFPRGGAPRNLLRLLGPRLRPSPRDPRLLLVTPPKDGGPDPPCPSPSPGLIARLLQGPGRGLGRLLGGPRGPAPRGQEAEPPFEVISCVTLGPRPSPPRGPAVTGEEWGRGHDAEGRSLDPEGLRERIFRGGLSPEVRPEGWRRLLGLRPWGGGGDPREPERRAGYLRLQPQWRSLSPGQWRRNRLLQRYRRRLERDLARCHPHLPPAQRLRLRRVLMSHSLFHFDLGYVRGMSEVLEPLLSVTRGESEAFWEFCSVMERVGGNFGAGGEGLEQQLGLLGQLVWLVEPEVGPRLETEVTRGCCRRWLQLRFRPHVGLEGALRLCEVLWTGLPCPNFLLVLGCAFLGLGGDLPPPPAATRGDSEWGTHGDTRGATPGESEWETRGDSEWETRGESEWETPGDTRGDSEWETPGDTRGDSEWETHGENEWETPGDSDSDSDGEEAPPGRWRVLDADEVLSRAEGLFLQLAAAPDLPPALRELLGLGGPPPTPPLEPLHPQTPGAPPAGPPPV